jgi:hypothetical protein
MMMMRRLLITVNTTTIILAMIIDGAGTCELGMMAARFGRACWTSCGKADSPHPRKFWVPMVPKPLGRTSRWGRSLRDAHLRLATRLLADHANPVYTLHKLCINAYFRKVDCWVKTAAAFSRDMKASILS